MCIGCANCRSCVHLDRWKRVLANRDLAKRQQRNTYAKAHGLRRGSGDWDWLDPNKNGFNKAMDPAQNGATAAFNKAGEALDQWGRTIKSELERWGSEIDKGFNEIGNFLSKMPQVLMDAFSPDGPLARTFDPNKNGVADGMRKLSDEVKRGLENSFDPEKNGVASAMREFGSDLEKGFESIGSTLANTFSKESMDRAFGPFVSAMNSFGDSCNQYFSDPSNIVSFLSICLSAIGTICPPPISNALSVLAACTEMIGNAIIGKPFDPMCLLDLAAAFIVPPASKLAKNIATSTAKATTILGKARAVAGAVQKTAVEAVKTSAKNIKAMTAAQKATLIGKTVFQVSGKIAGGVMGENNPVDSQRSQDQVDHDDTIAEEFFEDQTDPARSENSAEMDAEIRQDEYDKALKKARDARDIGTPVGDYKEINNKALEDLKESMTKNELEPSMREMTDRATEKPRSYARDEKIFFYRNATKDERDAEIEKAASEAVAATQAQEENKRVMLEAQGTKQARDEARVIENKQMKDDNEVRKYGFTYQEAMGRKMLYKEEQEKFALGTGLAIEKDLSPPTKSVVEKTGGRRKLKGGMFEGDSKIEAFMVADEINYGDTSDFGGAPYLPPIKTPTFFHFVKENFAPIPELNDPENWWKDYNTFIVAYNKQKADYNKLLQANQVAIAARNNMSIGEKDKIYQKWLSSDFNKKDPMVRAKAVLEQGGKPQIKDYIENLGFTVETWNRLMKTEKQEDLFLDGGPKTTIDTNVQAPQLIKPLSRDFEVPEAAEDDPILHERQVGGVLTSIPTPPKEDILAYYKFKAIQAEPRANPDELALMKAWELAWAVDPAQVSSEIRAYKLSLKGKGKKQRRRSISEFFKRSMRGGDEFNFDTFDPNAPEEPLVDAEGQTYTLDDNDPDTCVEMEKETYTTPMGIERWGINPDSPEFEASERCRIGKLEKKMRMEDYNDTIAGVLREEAKEAATTANQQALDELGMDLYGEQLPMALQEYQNAMPEDKRAARATFKALLQWGRDTFGTVRGNTIKAERPYYNAAGHFEDFFLSTNTWTMELVDRGMDGDTPKVAWEAEDDGKLMEEERIKQVAETAEKVKGQKDEEAKTKAFQDMDNAEVAEYNRLREEFKQAFDEAKDEEGKTKAITDFNANYPVGDARRLSGSGKPQATLVMRNLWLGNAQDAVNKAWLKKHKIKTVFNMTKDQPFTELNVKKVRFPIDDHPSNVELMTKMGPEWASQVFEAIAEGPVLLHCVEGRQRSPTLTTLLMGIQRPRKLKTLVKALKDKRPLCFNPTPTFGKSLQTWIK